jgi:hypothetical protein
MPSVTLKKLDKAHALNAMTESKFKARYAKLIERRRAMTKRVYDVTLGVVGNPLRGSAKRKTKGTNNTWQFWLDTQSQLRLPGVSVPTCRAVPTVKLRKNYYTYDLFTGTSGLDVTDPGSFFMTLPETVAWPENCYVSSVHVADADAATRKVAATLDRDINRFNKEVAEFYSKAWAVLNQLRTTRKVDAMFPELWDYLPEGLRQQANQAVVAITQAEVDELRKRLPVKDK